jgi:predicted metal-binding protein
MKNKIKIGIITCERYQNCTGGKCFKAMSKREGAFDIYKNKDIELVGYTTCGGCPGGNFEYAPEEMKKNGAEVIHFATGMIVGYPPCIYIDYFRKYIQSRFNLKVIVGTHPVPEKYYLTHLKINTGNIPGWNELMKPILKDKNVRVAYN